VGVAGNFTVRLLDQAGWPATNFRGTVHFTSSDPSAVLPADYTFTAADGGTHSFTATLNTVGIQSLTVTVQGSALTGVQSGIDVHEPGRALVPSLGQDLVYDPAGNDLYIVTSSGKVQRYDLDTGSLLAPWDVGVNLGGTEVVIGGMAKGSGMIAPNMATMLAFVTTDARVNPSLMHGALSLAADRSFNRISVDGDMSTNDMVLLLANGEAGNPEITSTSDPAYETFYEALEYVLTRLSKMIVVDGEGATKFVEIRVVETVREPDGLALSSRNAFLAPDERARALAIPRALATNDPQRARAVLAGAGIEPDYVEVADLDGPTLAIAAPVGGTRLIDNVLLKGTRRAPAHARPPRPRPRRASWRSPSSRR
jgi:hypothetical protein